MQQVIFLHGALGASASFDKLMSAARGSFECHPVDFPGHGKSEFESEFSIEFFTDFLLRYIEQNCAAPVSVFGYSMGGYIGLNAATHKPELFDKIMTLATKFDWTAEEGHKQSAMLNADKMEAKVPQYAQSLSQLHKDWKQVVSKTAELILKLAEHPPLNRDKLQIIETKVCSGIGDMDNMVSVNETLEIVRHCKHGSMYMIPGMPHPLEKMKVELVLAVMKDFFREC